MINRFPKDCWKKNCPHFHSRDLSIDDLVCTCDLLKIQCDACDEDFCLYLCPLPNELKERRCKAMARFIDAEKLDFSPLKDDFDRARAITITKFAPTADVVEVVRCKDCRMFVDNKEALVTYCTRECKSLAVNPDDFCSYGERKKTDEQKQEESC